MSASVIALLTDFGDREPYVGIMKGVVLSINSAVHFVDLTHKVPPQSVWTGALLLAQTIDHMPPDTIYVCIVDPGVGTSRAPILVTTSFGSFIGPDNGIFSWIYERGDDFTVYKITADHYFRKPVSKTFHGRDIFAPVAGWLSKGVDAQHLGEITDHFQKLKIPRNRHENGRIQGFVLHADIFGNLLTSITEAELLNLRSNPDDIKVRFRDKDLGPIRRDYQSAEKGTAFPIIGSFQKLEIAVANGSAKKLLEARRGDHVFVD